MSFTTHSQKQYLTIFITLYLVFNAPRIDVCDARKEIYLYKEFLSVSVWVRGLVEMVKVRD